MKKILYVVMAALVLVACNPNEPKVVSKDKKMLEHLNKMPETSLPQKNLTTPTQQDDQNEANAEGENVDEANAE